MDVFFINVMKDGWSGQSRYVHECSVAFSFFSFLSPFSSSSHTIKKKFVQGHFQLQRQEQEQEQVVIFNLFFLCVFHHFPTSSFDEAGPCVAIIALLLAYNCPICRDLV